MGGKSKRNLSKLLNSLDEIRYDINNNLLATASEDIIKFIALFKKYKYG